MLGTILVVLYIISVVLSFGMIIETIIKYGFNRFIEETKHDNMYMAAISVIFAIMILALIPLFNIFITMSFCSEILK